MEDNMKGVNYKNVFDTNYFQAGSAVKVSNPNRTFYGLVWNISDELLSIAVIFDYNVSPHELNIHISRVLSGEFTVEVLN
jgi:hypothetical protein